MNLTKKVFDLLNILNISVTVHKKSELESYSFYPFLGDKLTLKVSCTNRYEQSSYNEISALEFKDIYLDKFNPHEHTSLNVLFSDLTIHDWVREQDSNRKVFYGDWLNEFKEWVEARNKPA